MPWFDSEPEYYADPSGPLRQGDILVVPSVIIEPGDGEPPGAAPGEFGAERVVQLWSALSNVLPEAPTIRGRVRWDLGMVLPHDCALEKEFNERVASLIADGSDEETAILEASADRGLDRHVAIAPIRSYEVLPPERVAGVRTGQRLGTFPVVASKRFLVEPGWADLNAPTTVDRSLFAARMRIASLSERAADYLRAALSKHWAYKKPTPPARRAKRKM
jgi:hypothetical protein